jgi:hypothetical protein
MTATDRHSISNTGLAVSRDFNEVRRDLHATIRRKRVVSLTLIPIQLTRTYLYVAYITSSALALSIRTPENGTYLVYRVLPILATRQDGFLDHRVKVPFRVSLLLHARN